MSAKKLSERLLIIDTYLKGAVQLYGFVTPRQFLKVFNRYNEPKLLKLELLQHLEKLNKTSSGFYGVYTNAIVNSAVSEEKIDQIFTLQQGKSFYMPTKEEILFRSKPSYYEVTPEVKRLRDHFLKNLKVNLLSIDSLMQKLLFLIITEERNQAIFDLMERFGIIFKNMNEANQTYHLIANVNNNTRKWANCGFTPKELSKTISIPTK